MKNIIEIKGLNKSFGDVHAVRDLSFGVRAGELFAFLGVNGAGKSTTINILCGQLAKDGGRVEIDGRFVTACGMGAAVEFGLALTAILKGEQAAETIASAVFAK